ncbi:MAG: Npt1/Npt2 family nucleotide transporter [Candidatus Krumholzibacteriia bacterium]
MSIRDRILSALALGPQELRPLLLLTGTNFLTMLSYVVAKSVRDAVLLARVDLQNLPYIYIAVAVVLILLFNAYAWLRARVALTRLLVGTYLAIAAVLAGFYLALGAGLAWAPLVFYVWVNVYGALVFTQFWLCFHALTSRRGSRRLITMVAAGALVGQVVGGQLVRLVAGGPLGGRPEALIGIVVVVLLGSMATMLAAIEAWSPAAVMMTSPGSRLRRTDAQAARARPRSPLQEIVRSRYLRSMALFILVGMVASTVLDFLFKVTVQQAVPPERLAGFFGSFYALVGVAALVVQFVGTPILLQRFGLGAALLVLPLLLLAAGGAAVVYTVLTTVVVAKGLDAGLRNSVLKSGAELLYLPLNPSRRRHVKPTLDAVSERLGDAVGGVLILVALQLGWGTQRLGWLLLGLIGIWLVWGWRAQLFYVRALRTRLRPSVGQELPGRAELEDLGGLEPLLRLLNSPDSARVIEALDLFAAYGKQDVIPAVLLAHRDPEVRLHTLRVLRASGRRDGFGFLDPLLSDPDRRVRHLALTTLADADPGFALRRLALFEDDPDPGARASHAYALLKLGTGPERGRALQMLDELRRGRPAERLAVARTLGRSSERLPLEWLEELLRDTSVEVRAAAAEAAARHQTLELVEPLCDLLYARRTAEPARRALVAIGDEAVPRLLEIFRSRAAAWLRLQVVVLLRDIGTAKAAEALLECLDTAEEWLANDVLGALGDLVSGPRQHPVPRPRIRALLATEVDRVRFFLGRQEMVTTARGSDGARARLLGDLLRERAAAALERSFRLLELLYPSREILTAFERHRDGDAETRTTAAAFLNAVLPQPHRHLLLEFLEELPLQQRLQRAGVSLPDSIPVVLRSLVSRPDPLLQAATLAAAADLGALAELARFVRVDPEAPLIVQEAAALVRLAEV